MLQTSLPKDTLLRQLHQAVEIESSQSLDVSRQLVAPAEVRIDSAGQSGELHQKAKTAEISPAAWMRRLTIEKEKSVALPPVSPIQPNEIVLLTQQTEMPRLMLPERKIERDTPDWVTGLIIIVLVIFASVRLFFGKYLGQLFSSSVNFSTASRMFRERSVSLTHASFRLDVIFYLVFSLFMFQTLEEFYFDFHKHSILTYLFTLAGVLVYFGLKQLAYYLQGSISECLPETQEYIYHMNLYNRLVGLVLLPVSLVVAFAPLSNPDLLIVFGLIVVGFFYILLLFRGTSILLRKHFSIFYLILYLCTLEILPLIFIYKLVLV